MKTPRGYLTKETVEHTKARREDQENGQQKILSHYFRKIKHHRFTAQPEQPRTIDVVYPIAFQAIAFEAKKKWFTPWSVSGHSI